MIKNKFAHKQFSLKNAALVTLSLASMVSVSSFADQPKRINPKKETAIFSQFAIHHPIWAENGMVASQEALATQIGVDILKQGGNAVDAAVAVGYALAVTLPRAGNIGGGGFMLVYLADEKRTIAIDYREMAPNKAHRDMYLDENGNANARLSRFHGLAVGIPGTVMGMQHALKKYGTMSTKQVIEPAIKLARDGIAVSPDLANSLAAMNRRLSHWPSTQEIFYKSDGGNYKPGEMLYQKELADSLERIKKHGTKGFYHGETAKLISKAVIDAGGIMTVEDLANYRVVERKPVTGTYRGYEVVSMPPPSSGGVHIVQMLNALEQFPIKEMGANSADTVHVMAEVMRRAYADRSHYLGDPDFHQVPIKGLSSKTYGKEIAAMIDMNKATPSTEVSPAKKLPYESNETTHYSVVDKWGNAVSNTYTLNFSYGAGLVAKGTGILLNNEMDDFSAKPGSPNGFGLLGGEANSVQPYKRPLSSMTPTIVLKDGKAHLVTGSPGGSRIITTTLQLIMNVLDHEMNIATASAMPRFHHQWWPDELRIEEGFSKDTLKLLKTKGHKIKLKSSMGSTQTIMPTENGVYGASDPRRPAALSKGH
ncbi:gamma-glutamyltransferase [Psychrobium sp. MM17-31]|uniref:gamma-glutamyltransferase n=1 Tax=Psychrobium sp. MM17-31 TaxID=2917758 RepID=UPI001EF415B2|nr:gamma-glutamyltransferase [Psychrobium sp. MM17-31]MCG7529810.1 gamma-glutamyltransferase [Psychrobium sp. MM17-31]